MIDIYTYKILKVWLYIKATDTTIPFQEYEQSVYHEFVSTCKYLGPASNRNFRLKIMKTQTNGVLEYGDGRKRHVTQYINKKTGLP